MLSNKTFTQPFQTFREANRGSASHPYQITKKKEGNEKIILLKYFLLLINIISGKRENIIKENLLEIAKTDSKDKYLKLLILKLLKFKNL